MVPECTKPYYMLRSLSARSLRAHGARWLASDATAKPIFFDMKHSNNAARVRLWLALKADSMSNIVDSQVVQYPDLQTPAFAAVNPLKKVPALIRGDGETVFESAVILSYLEDKYSDAGPSMKPPTPEGRQQMELMIRIHDLYVASPNCTAPGFSHSQGAMYLSTGWHGAARGMDLPTRAAKMAELWKQMSWLEANCSPQGPYLLTGDSPSLADFTWFPTCVFMEFMLPMFGWPDVFNTDGSSPFPKLAKWYSGLKNADAFASVHTDIWDYWVEMKEQGQFEPILAELQSEEARDLKFRYGHTQTVELNYQEPPPPGKRTGRYINQDDQGDVDDETVAKDVTMGDGRELVPAASLPNMGFELRPWPTECIDFRDDEQVCAVHPFIVWRECVGACVLMSSPGPGGEYILP
jgi:glutathione S-transferase